LELARQQAEYEVKFATRRYEAADPDNRLVVAELEARWNAALLRLRECEERLAASAGEPPAPKVTRESLLTLADDLEAAWHAPTTDRRTRQRLVRALIEEIVVDVDDAMRDVMLVIHWRGGQHSELRVRKPAPGEHTKLASADADRVIREMATRWSDTHIAATLNRMGLATGYGNTWTHARVGSYRRKAGIHGYELAVKDGRCLTMLDAANMLGVTCHVHPQVDSRWGLACTTGDVRRSLANRGHRSRTLRSAGRATPPPDASRPPVSQCGRYPHPHDSGHLRRRGTMKRGSPHGGARARRRCYR
jgi:hypothetical protein